MSYPPPPPPEQPGWTPQQGYPQPAYPQPGYPQPGYPQPGYPQPGYPPYAQPPKKRPSGWWFLPGGIALMLALGCVVVAVVTGVKMYRTDGYLLADNISHSFDLREGDHMLFVGDDDPVFQCSAHDDSGLITVDFLDIDDQESLEIDSVSWVPFAKFHSAGDPVMITCTGQGEEIRIGAPAGETQIVTLGLSALAAIGLGVLGLAGLVTVGVLFLTRKPRSVTG